MALNIIIYLSSSMQHLLKIDEILSKLKVDYECLKDAKRFYQYGIQAKA